MNNHDNNSILLFHKGKIIWKFIISIVLNVLLLIIPIYYSKLIDALNIINYEESYNLLIIFGILTISYRFIEFYNQKAYFKLYLSLYKSYMNFGLNKTYHNSIYSLSRFNLSEYSNIMSEDFEFVSDYYSTLIIRIVEILEFIYIIIYFFFINKIIGIITFISSIIVIFILFYFNTFISKINIERKNRNDIRISSFQEIFLSLKTIKGFRILKEIKNKINQKVDEYIKWHTRLNMDRYGLREVTLGIIDISKIIALLLGIKLIIDGNMTLGTITIIYSYYSKLSELFTSIITLSESKNNKDVSNKRINKLFMYAQDDKKSNNENIINGQIVFQNILYGNINNPILKDVSFKIESNNLTVLSGSNTGCEGIFDLLLRYNREHSGNILIDNININDYDEEDIKNNIGFIMEYPNFFNMSIKDNLILFDENFENIVNVCKYLEIDEYIMNLKDGYETILIDNASNIDEDVKYLLALARVLLRNCKILLINNIFDHISGPICRQLEKILITLKDERTIVLITRNQKIMKKDYVNKVIFIAYGKVVCEGKHEYLVKNNSEYKKLLKKM